MPFGWFCTPLIRRFIEKGGAIVRKKALVCLVVVLALALMGFGFAKWSDSVVVSATAQSGSVKWGIIDESVWQLDEGTDWHSEMEGGMLNYDQDPEGKDVGSTSIEVTDANEDGVKDTLDITVSNAYPCYFNEITFDVINAGTIPVIVQIPKLTWMRTESELESGVVYYLCSNGSIISEYDDGFVSPEENGAVIEVMFQDNVSAQQHPGEVLSESICFHVLQPAAQNDQYSFSLSIEGVQWNESPIPAGSVGD
jgi:hypothetical protein